MSHHYSGPNFVFPRGDARLDFTDLYPNNGRALTDDAIDAFLAILTNGKVTEDRVGPHGDLVTEFPYLGPPHNGSR